MVTVLIFAVLLALTQYAAAQEVLLPLQSAPRTLHAVKAGTTFVRLPFFDDFAGYEGVTNPTLWRDGMGHVNTGYGELPPTLGMLTLDALDAEGNLYAAAATTPFSADTVTSQPIRLEGLSAADSVVMSFYFLPGGGRGNLWERVGDTPEEGDSLILEFYSASEAEWERVWSTGGVSVDSLVARTGRDWQYVVIPIADPRYFDSMFAFRFRNYCSLDDNAKPGMVGNCDQWNIDYVLIDRGRSADPEPVFRDVAFVEPAGSLLSTYRAMPARQYRAADMAGNTSAVITNLYSSQLASQYVYRIIGPSGDIVHTYDGGYENAPPFLPSAGYQSAQAHARAAVEYAFPESNEAREYIVEHIVREGAGGDVYPRNDTTRFRQQFFDYYAYDDGTPENGYGLTSTSSRIYLACRFDLNVPDTLTAVDLYFNRTRGGENEDIPFYISVWSSIDGEPGTLLYRDEVRRLPSFGSLNQYKRYVLESPLEVQGSIFVGFEQSSNRFINLGFDRSNNTADRIYYLTGTQWQQSILSGSLMLRPCFGQAATVGVGSTAESLPPVRLSPNPASMSVMCSGIDAPCRVEAYDAQGRRVLAMSHMGGSLCLDTSCWPDGLYLIRFTDSLSGRQTSSKLLIRH